MYLFLLKNTGFLVQTSFAKDRFDKSLSFRMLQYLLNEFVRQSQNKRAKFITGFAAFLPYAQRLVAFPAHP